MKTRCVNLREQEAIAAAMGKLTTIVRPVNVPAHWRIDKRRGLVVYFKKRKYGTFIRRGLGTRFPQSDFIKCPFGAPGDILIGREAWWFDDENNHVWYKCGEDGSRTYGPPYKSPAVMPAEYARHRFKVVGVDVKKFGSITDKECCQSGYEWDYGAGARGTMEAALKHTADASCWFVKIEREAE